MRTIYPLGTRVRTLTSVAIIGAILAGFTISSFGHDGKPSSLLDLNAGTAWFVDRATGQASLLDGGTASRISEQRVAAPGDDISVVPSGVQSGSGAYVVDHTTGAVTPIDGATLQPGSPVRFSTPGDPSLALVSNPRATWVIEQDGSLVQQVAPTTLDPLGPPLPLSGTSAQVETPDGSLWTAGAGGFVYSFGAGVQHSRSRPVRGQFTLVEAGSQPAAADVSQGQVAILGSRGTATRRIAFNPPGTAPTVSGAGAAPYVMAVGPTDGDLQVTDIADSRPANTAIGDTSRTPRYGTAVSSGNEIFVPDYAQGAVVVVEARDGQLAAVGQVSVGLHSFDLFDYDGSVWFDDPATADAGVITTDPSGDLEAVEIPKSGGDGQGTVVGHLTPVRFRSLNHPGPDTSSITASRGAPTSAATHSTTTAQPITTIPPTTTSQSTTTIQATTTTTMPAPTMPAPTVPASTATTSAGPAPLPGFTWSPMPAVAGRAETFLDTTANPHRIFQWTFADAEGQAFLTTTTSSPTVTLSTGTYLITLVVTEAGQSYSTRRLVDVGAAPPTVACSGTSVKVDAWIDSSPSKTVNVPPGCTKASFMVNGADGGTVKDPPASNYGGGGPGAQVTVSNYPVTPGEKVVLEAGRPGGDGPSNGCTRDEAECNGGIAGCAGAGASGGGGGMSSVMINGAYAIIAGGGGGSSLGGLGDSGGATGPQDGTETGGGRPAAPNASGSGSTPAQPGTHYQGGNGTTDGNLIAGGLCNGFAQATAGGAGGGGGLYGGAGGTLVCLACGTGPPIGGSGGGGSNLVPAGGKATTGGAKTDDGAGVVTVTFT